MKQDYSPCSTDPLAADADNTPGYIYLRFAAEHLEASGFENPLNIVDELYQQCLPSEDEYQAEVAILEEYYFSVREKAAYLKIIEELAGNDEKKYAQLYDACRTKEDRLKFAGEAYKKAISNIPPFSPAKREDFYERLKDLPHPIHKIVYEKALQMAKDRLRM